MMNFSPDISFYYFVILINVSIAITSFGQTTGDLYIQTAKTHLGKPYESNTLDFQNEEVLTIDSIQFDCVTFVEYVIAQTLSKKPPKYSNFDKILTSLRYRNGKMNGYESRIHYFSEWLLQVEKNGIGKNISHSLGGEFRKKQIHFMSSNGHKYPKLTDSTVMSKIRETEIILSDINIPYVPNRNVEKILPKLQNGDIFAFVSSVKGLDISHTGFIILIHQKPHLLHASFRTKKVEISKLPIDQYMKTIPFIDGIIIFRNTIQ
ncbi:MAG: DUF1460 domain-containing protein [Saprospiraceae bacterium]|nr:DUF1460 domain-containing protein [Saprospiraceae bacterium]